MSLAFGIFFPYLYPYFNFGMDCNTLILMYHLPILDSSVLHCVLFLIIRNSMAITEHYEETEGFGGNRKWVRHTGYDHTLCEGAPPGQNLPSNSAHFTSSLQIYQFSRICLKRWWMIHCKGDFNCLIVTLAAGILCLLQSWWQSALTE